MAKKADNPENPESGGAEGGSALRSALSGKAAGEERAQAAPASAAPAPEAHAPAGHDFSLGGPSYLDRAVFCRQLATLIEIGIPMLKALQMLAARTPNGKLRRAIQEAADGVEKGESIHQSFARNARIFSPIVISIVRIGETGGILERSLLRLAEIMEMRSKIKRKVVTASMYPAVALLVAIGVVILIMTRAIPVFAEVYTQAGKFSELPMPTQLIINLSKFMQSAWWLVIGLIIVAIIGLNLAGRTPGGARLYSWLALRLPVFRNVARKVAVAHSSKTLGGLLTAGIPLVESLRIASESSDNVIVAEALQDVRQVVERGDKMASPLAEAGIFPPLVVDMISIGEETGTLDRMLSKIAEIYDAEVDATFSGLSSIIEPVLIVVLGGVVMFIALAVLLPYFNMVHLTEG